MRKRYAPRQDWYARASDYLARLKKRRKKFYYRCGKCRKRKVLKMELWEYQIPPRCCKGVYWTLDMDRYKAWQNKTGAYAICYCGFDTWGAKHKPGSTVMCEKSTRWR